MAEFMPMFILEWLFGYYLNKTCNERERWTGKKCMKF